MTLDHEFQDLPSALLGFLWSGSRKPDGTAKHQEIVIIDVFASYRIDNAVALLLEERVRMRHALVYLTVDDFAEEGFAPDCPSIASWMGLRVDEVMDATPFVNLFPSPQFQIRRMSPSAVVPVHGAY